MQVNIWVLFLTLAALLKLSETARILAVFPTPSLSHQLVFRPLTQELARRGHTITIVTTDPAFPKGKSPANLTEIDVHEISYSVYQDEFISKYVGKDQNMYRVIKAGLYVLHDIFIKQLETPEFKRLIDDKVKFDLLLVEACMRPAMIMSHVFKAPMILVSSFGSVSYYRIVGAPSHEFLYPSSLRKRMYNLTIWEKITELFKIYAIKYLLYSLESDEHELLKKHFGETAPSIHELRNNVDMLFLNIHPIWEGIRPVPPSVVYMGGIHQHLKSELPKDITSFIDSSNGTIYVSFGTNIDTSQIPQHVTRAMVNVFSKQPYSILLKWNNDTLPGQTKNIKIAKRFPQADLLKHPKIKLFITQGGLQSTDEAICSGVPLIGIPMLGEQWYNVEKYVHHGIGEKIELESMTEENFKNTIDKVITNDSYRRNINHLCTLMLDQPQGPLERAIWWTEHVIRHSGAAHLRSPTANAIWLEYVELEFFLLTLLLLLLLSLAGIGICVSFRFRRRREKLKMF